IRARSGPLTVTRAAPPVAGLSVVDRPCVAFAIPRRVGGAVVRNRIRRRLRAVFAEGAGGAIGPGAYLVAVRPGADQLTYRALSDHVHRALTQIADREARRRTPSVDRARPT